MKKNNKKYYILFTLIATLCIVLLLASCKPAKTLKPTANIRLTEENLLEWDEVEGANGYLVDINGTEYDNKQNSLDVINIFVDSGTYDVSVMPYHHDQKNNQITGEVVSCKIEYQINVLQQEDFYSGFAAAEDFDFNLTPIGNGLMIQVKNNLNIVGRVKIPSHLTAPDGVTYPIVAIAPDGFANCTKLTGIYMPDTITYLHAGAFAGCINLKWVRFSSNLMEFAYPREWSGPGIDLYEKRQFEYCSLRRISIPKSLIKFTAESFKECPLEQIVVEEGNPVFKSDGNCLIMDENILYIGCVNSVIPDYVTMIFNKAFARTKIKEIVIPENISQINSKAFYSCEELQSVTILCTNLELKEYVFEGCSQLKTINLNNSIKKISNHTFINLDSLEELTLPDSVTRIDDRAIADCKNLKTLNLGNGVESIPFDLCENTAVQSLHLPKSLKEISSSSCPSNRFNLTTLTVDEQNPLFKSEGNCIIRKSDNAVVLGCSGSVIPDYVTKIERCAFAGCGFESIKIPYGVTEIGKQAFWGCVYLKEVYIPNSVTTIQDSAFGEVNCSLTLPESVTTIGYSAFAGADVYLAQEKTPETNGVAVYSCKIAYDENNYPYVVSFVKTAFGVKFDVKIPTRYGYVFEGWTAEQDGTQIICGIERVEEGIIISSSYYTIVKYITLQTEIFKSFEYGTTLYAKWTPAK